MSGANQLVDPIIRLGEVDIARVVDVVLDNGYPRQMFPMFDEGQWSTHAGLIHEADRDDRTRAGFTMSHQSWVLRSAGRTVLVDTGLGNHKQRSAPAYHDLQTPYLSRLAAVGVLPEDVDVVVITHLHTDHVGWNTVREGDTWVPTFPRATYLLPEADVRFFDPGNDGSVTRVSDSFMRHVFEDSVRPVLNAGQAETWEGFYDLDENLRLEAAPGHTPGNAVVTLRSGEDRAVFVGDLLHSPVQFALPDWNNCMCEQPAQSRESRRRILSRAADERQLVFAAHFGGDHAAEIERRGDAFAVREWRP